MKAINKILALGLAAGLALMPVGVKADTSASVAFKNKYLASSGFLFAEEPVMQPSLTYFNNSFYGVLGFNVSSEEGLNEVDYIAGFSKDIGERTNLDVGAGVFDLRDQGENDANDNIADAWIKLKRGLTPKTSLEMGVAQNLEGGTFSNPKGRDWNIALGYKTRMFNLKTDVHYNERYFSPDSGLSVAQVSGNTPFDLGKLSITPEVLFQKALDKKNFGDNTMFGVSVSRNF